MRLINALIFTIALVPFTAKAAIVSTTEDVVVISAPNDVRTGSLENATEIRAFVERQLLLLVQVLAQAITQPGESPSQSGSNLSPGLVPAGTRVSSYFLHFDRPLLPPGAATAAGSITFDADILGIAVKMTTLDASDSVLGLSSTLYPTGDQFRDLEIGNDHITLSPERRTITLDLRNVDGVDQVRIVTSAVPEPSTLHLAGIGAIFVFAIVSRTRTKTASIPS